MHEFKLWAPRPNKVSVQICNQLHPMEGPDEHGMWHALVETCGPGDDYGFVLDDDPQAWPDPRSKWQPNGVHGLSRIYDQKAFHWRDQFWQGPPLTGAIIYEMHIGTFTKDGTFDSAITKLHELQALGVTHIEVMPVAAYAGDRGWGYDGVALFAVTENYGGPEALKRFVDACHDTGLAVLLDVVYNHFGPVGNYTGKYGPYVTNRHITPWGDAINFEEAGSDEVRRFFCDNALMWMRDFHFDGLRLDAVHEFMDRSALHFMEQLSAEVDVASATLGRRLVLIAESDLNDPRIVTPREARGYGMDAQWSDDFHHALFTILHCDEGGKGYYDDFGSLDKLVKSLKDIFVYDGVYSKYRKRRHGRPVIGLSAHHFIGFIQNHDQVGNRATGDRLEHIIGLDKAKVAAGIVLTSPFTPMIFQGEEFAASTPFQYFADHEDEEMAKLVSAGRKKEFAAFGWDDGLIPDPEDRETFLRSKLNWDEVHQDYHADMLDWFTKLIHIRRASPSLNDGDTAHTQIIFEPEDKWLVMERGQVKVLTNLGSKPAEFDVPSGYRLIAQSRPEVTIEGEKAKLPPNTFAILSSEEAPE
ncbi:maltooligosyltrehalose trehalohydrolase [Granulicella aggregans]|uniref:Malto-oligosyltrehalose trehalohydrolase n=1 Tax=Granulicella aggregans TaxID=474949 RepID=A0A7W8E2L0_9BACT|nr:malto-oligosyltrehalose trehalohydrolase [Granulicella aggregans]MBB5056627.1 maltooligosyltrehalose trehalohydrolase [Granulicella aggregans]